MEEGFVLMNLSKYKRWRALFNSDCKTTNTEQTHPVCLHAVEKYTSKVESVNTQNDYETASKKNEQIRRKQTCILCVYSQWKSTLVRWRALIHRMIMKQQVKKMNR